MFWATVLVENRLNCWKIMPIFWRIGRSFDSLSWSTRVPSTVTDPDVGRSNALTMRTSVDLPAPEYPMMP